MSKIYFQGTFGAYSHLAALSIEPNSEIIPCKTFDECFAKAMKDTNSKIIIPESNRITGNIGIEYLIFQYRLNIYSEYFQKIEHNLLAVPGAKISEIQNVYSHSQALSQCSNFIKSHNLIELENGQYALYPNNRMRIYDNSLTPVEPKMPDFKVSTQYYQVENGFERLGMGREDEYFWKTSKERKIEEEKAEDMYKSQEDRPLDP